MALVLAGRRREADRAFEWLAATQQPDGTWCRYYLAEGIEDPRRDPNVCAYVATGTWWHYLCTGDLGLLERCGRWSRGPSASCCACSSPGARCCGRWIPTGPRAASPCSPARRRSTTACAAPWPSPSASGSSGPNGSWPPTGSPRPIVHRPGSFRPQGPLGHGLVLPGPLRGRLPASAARSGSTAGGRSSCSTGVGVRCVSDQPWVTAAETAECVMALDAIGLRDRAVDAARLDPAPARRRRRLLDGMRAPAVRALSRAVSAAPTPPPPSCWPTTPSTAAASSAGLFRGETLPAVVDLADVPSGSAKAEPAVTARGAAAGGEWPARLATLAGVGPRCGDSGRRAARSSTSWPPGDRKRCRPESRILDRRRRPGRRREGDRPAARPRPR